jgi:alpha-tubulin suppressor-like RCC1 family protein
MTAHTMSRNLDEERSMHRRLLSFCTRITVVAVVAGSLTVATASAASAATVTSVAAGYDHTCALTSSGGVRCWGVNDDGQLGDGTTTTSLSPVNVSGLTSGVVGVSAGLHYSCALTSLGGVRCWGKGSNGQLGDGAGTRSSVPVTPVGLSSDVRSVSVGNAHVCALMRDATVRCWGSNGQGQLGDGTRTSSLVPQTVPGLTGVVQLATGGVHTCVLTGTGGVKCWGYDAYGQVGNGTAAPAPEGDVLWPADVVGLSGVASIAVGGYHSCAMLADGTAECWGQNIGGEIGDGTKVNRTAPVPVVAPAGGFTTLVLGSYDTCAVTSQGGAMCWGEGNLGQIGDGASVDRTVPTDLPGASSGTAALAVGRAHACRVDSSGLLTCWGWNQAGQVGTGATSFSVTTPAPVVWFGAGYTSSCSGLVCSFTDQSSDPDGEIVSRTWSFGDGASGSGATASRTFAAGGTYVTTLTTRNSAGTTSRATASIIVTPWNLLASVNKVRNVNTVSLTWNAGATSSATVDVQLNGVLLTRVSNTGSFSQTASKGTFTYRVCPTCDSRCSSQVTVKI